MCHDTCVLHINICHACCQCLVWWWQALVMHDLRLRIWQHCWPLAITSACSLSFLWHFPLPLMTVFCDLNSFLYLSSDGFLFVDRRVKLTWSWMSRFDNLIHSPFGYVNFVNAFVTWSLDSCKLCVKSKSNKFASSKTTAVAPMTRACTHSLLSRAAKHMTLCLLLLSLCGPLPYVRLTDGPSPTWVHRVSLA